MTTTITIELVKGQILTSNQRHGHWGGRASRTETIRALARAAWMKAGRPQLDTAICDVIVTQPARKWLRDVHNMMPTAKAAIDGMVHPARGVRGILPDDSDKYLRGPFLWPSDEVMPTRPGGYTRIRLDFHFKPWPADGPGVVVSHG